MAYTYSHTHTFIVVWLIRGAHACRPCLCQPSSAYPYDPVIPSIRASSAGGSTGHGMALFARLMACDGIVALVQDDKEWPELLQKLKVGAEAKGDLLLS